MAVAFDNADTECVANKVPVTVFQQQVVGTSEATSIRARVTTGSEIHVKAVFAQMIEVQRRLKNAASWTRFKLMQPIH